MREKVAMASAGKSVEELSDLIGREGQAGTGALLGEGLRSRGARELTAKTHVGEQCGRTLVRQRQDHRRTRESRQGESKIERPYVYCRQCQRGSHPLDVP